MQLQVLGVESRLLPQRECTRPLALIAPDSLHAAFLWTADVPIHARAMALAGDTLFVAGPPTSSTKAPRAQPKSACPLC